MVNILRTIVASVYARKKKSYIANLCAKGLHIGDETEIMDPFFLDPDHCFLISIGNNCTLAPNVRFIAHDASTKRYLNYTKIGKIVVHDNCFIGDSTIILPNVSIGPNTIVGAGSIVIKNMPADVVVAGNPAKVICTLDDYIAKVVAKSEQTGVYGKEYLIHNITPERKIEMLSALSKDEGFIV